MAAFRMTESRFMTAWRTLRCLLLFPGHPEAEVDNVGQELVRHGGLVRSQCLAASESFPRIANGTQEGN